ncbi:uncharacterized protein LOC130671799 [Microplitis mediator]|uniref:uncharacterized protein LOC130664998 n=1 Tax=Microplitis mediator TaxID=375433 RepID=UPI0025547A64|nr:uncharacterized protein LOC130664998 [Microplitis mediator]XP_057328622.1 uncharacterized protein LOC130669639 [Microplitis mediator]XP_057331860.1 uncharacterized protein LOC130671799 [Microplitis mediator]
MADLTRQCTPPNLVAAAQKATLNLLPKKSKALYNKAYDKFLDWRKLNKTESFSETVILAYLNHLSETLSPSTLWSQFSMIKTTILLNHNVDIKNYGKVTAFLKNKSIGYKPKKAKTLTSNEVEKFLNEAPDEIYLALKAILIFGVSGACRRGELSSMTTNNIKIVDESTILVQLPKTKTNVARSFTIIDTFNEVVKKYMSTRPKETKIDRFFLKYANGKCQQQPMGINKIGSIPKIIAEYLKLPEPELYTGHSLRRTSATLLADAGADLLTLKRHGGWKSSNVAEGYIDDSVGNKKEIASKIKKNIILNKENQTIETSEANIEITEDINQNELVKDNLSAVVSQVQNTTVHKNLDISSTITMPSKNMNFSFHNCTVNFNFDNK